MVKKFWEMVVLHVSHTHHSINFSPSSSHTKEEVVNMEKKKKKKLSLDFFGGGVAVECFF